MDGRITIPERGELKLTGGLLYRDWVPFSRYSAGIQQTPGPEIQVKGFETAIALGPWTSHYRARQLY